MQSLLRSVYMVYTVLLIAITVAPASLPAQKSVKDSSTAHHQHITNLTNIAHKFEKQGDKKTALYYHNLALQKSKEFHLPEREARTLIHIARILKEEDTSKSLEHLKSALVIAKRINYKELESDIYLAMADIYRQQENYSEALHALEEHHHLLDSLFAQNKTREIARIKVLDETNLERKLWLAIVSAVVLISLVFVFYFIRTKKLNTALRQSNLVKDKLFSILGHDLRGPAGNIAQSLALVESGALPPDEQEELLSLLKKQSDAFSETLNSLLEWAHCQLKGIHVQPRHFDAKTIISKNMEMLSGQCMNKQIHIEDNTPGSLFIFADEHHFDIIIRNLLSNAIKFSHLRSVIKINAREKNDEIIFSVSDEGIGISPARQKQFNTSGIEVSYGTKGEKGTGLGLLLTKEFALADGGRIWLTSEEGKGTTFYFSIKKSYKP